MELKQYVQDAIRTESVIDVARVNDRFAFEDVVGAFVAAAQLLDLYKKNIYYKKPVSDEKWMGAVNLLVDSATSLRRGHYHPLSATESLTINTRVLHAIIGIATESGELMEVIHNNLRTYQAIDPVNIQEELGDLNWYHAIAVDALGADWEKIQETNIAKLRARYPEKFTSEAAINRDLDTERQILEEGDARAKAEENYPFGGSDYK